jgi:hypothetical protein
VSENANIPIHRALRDEDGCIVYDAQRRPHIRPPHGAQPLATLNRAAGVLEIPAGHISLNWHNWYGPAPRTYFVHLSSIARPYSNDPGILQEPERPSLQPRPGRTFVPAS